MLFPDGPSTTPRRRAWICPGLITVAVAAWFVTRMAGPPSSQSQLASARSAAERRDWETAIRLARQVAVRDSGATEAWRLVAQWSARRGQFRDAVDAWERVPEASTDAKDARLQAASTALRELRSLERAERNYRQAVAIDDTDPAALDGLAQTLAVGGRWRELLPVLLRLIQLDAFSNFHLDLIARGSDINVDPQFLQPQNGLAPGDFTSRCAQVRLLLQAHDSARALEELERIFADGYCEADAQLLYGKSLLLNAADERLREWLISGLKSLNDESEFWAIALSSCLRWRDEPASVRCAWELLRRDPNEQEAYLPLQRAFEQNGEMELASRLVERAKLLDAYGRSVMSARDPQNLQAIEHCVQLAERLGLMWEAWGWTRIAARLNSRQDWVHRAADRLRPQLSSLPLERTVAAFNPASQIRGDRFPLPTFRVDGRTPSSAPRSQSGTPLTFHDEAVPFGLFFQYDNGGNCLADGLRHMHEFTGGGVGVIDFDRDQWPDLFFPQGGLSPDQRQPVTKTDRLWRNWGGESWEDVTNAAALSDSGFGQGATVGDVNNDGFADLLVLNIGRSRLWYNQGDGSFAPAETFDDVLKPAWSISAGIADLDGDSIPDIYVVNYLGGEDVFTKICPDGQGVPRLTCQPLIFDAEPDQILRGLGDGRFEDVSASSAINNPAGRGMGLIIGRISQQHSLEVFVANDSTANNHYVRTRSANGLQYVDDAFRLGTAVDRMGRSQACMGIAADDVDGDGRLDLLVTNFEDETNTLYQQSDEGLFSDRSQEFELDSPSRRMLGFGTQFLDVDLDGYPELFVANGHVNDRRDNRSLYQMPPQLFRNVRGTRFELVYPDEAGQYFGGNYLGRGVAVLDWNRDGLTDVAVSHLDRPASVLTNYSEGVGHWLQLQCVATRSARDAIGTRVTIRHDEQVVRRQLLAGDGYASTNQRMICVGLGRRAMQTVELEIEWPDGATQTVRNAPIDRSLLIVEGREPIWSLSVE